MILVVICEFCSWQINVFLNRLNGDPIGVSVLGIFVIDKNTILAVSSLCYVMFYSIEVVILRCSIAYCVLKRHNRSGLEKTVLQ